MRQPASLARRLPGPATLCAVTRVRCVAPAGIRNGSLPCLKMPRIVSRGGVPFFTFARECPPNFCRSAGEIGPFRISLVHHARDAGRRQVRESRTPWEGGGTAARGDDLHWRAWDGGRPC
jgi:hypothetical protein